MPRRLSRLRKLIALRNENRKNIPAMPAKPRLTLLLPGLPSPAPGQGADRVPLSRFPSLKRLLARADRVSVPAKSVEATLFELFGINNTSDQNLPVAPLTWLADTGDSPEGFWFRADPVHLRADLSKVRLFDSASLDITAEEAAALAEAFNELYAELGWHLDVPAPQRWYLRLPEPPGITTTPISEVAGKSIDAFLPRGKAATHWHAILNEVQMLFHTHPVNQAREAAGRPMINSVWFWGGGYLPRLTRSAWSAVYTDDALVMGLAQCAETPRRDLPAHAGEWMAGLPQGDGLMVLPDLLPATRYDQDAWRTTLERLEQTWISPLYALVQKRRLGSLRLLSDNGTSYLFKPGHHWRVWRRNRHWA